MVNNLLNFKDFSVRQKAGVNSKPASTVVDETINVQKTKFVEPKGRDFPLASALRKVYAGEWQDDMKSGSGIYFYENGDVYDGTWSRNMKQGWGRLNYADGSVYEGEWNEENRHGQGILLMENGDRYEGTQPS
jgi:hypothetical protein